MPGLVQLAPPRLPIRVQFALRLFILALSMVVPLLAFETRHSIPGNVVREHTEAWQVGVRDHRWRYVDYRIVVQFNVLGFRHCRKIGEQRFEQVLLAAYGRDRLDEMEIILFEEEELGKVSSTVYPGVE